jgi:hypothetical protein
VEAMLRVRAGWMAATDRFVRFCLRGNLKTRSFSDKKNLIFFSSSYDLKKIEFQFFLAFSYTTMLL